MARGEVDELAATLETALRLALVPPAFAHELRRLPQRVGAMLTGLIQRESRRAESSG